MNVRLLKRDLRREVQQLLKKPAAEEVCEECIPLNSFLRLLTISANRCAASLFQLSQFVHSRNISVYLSMPTGELQTTSIVEKCFHFGTKNDFA
jgi:hypothetical protein